MNGSKKLITKEEINQCKEIIEKLEENPCSADFLEPVDYKALGLDDYPSIVKNPMDLSTIKKKLMNIKYNTLQEVFDDIQLIWDNCRLYNMEGSDIYKVANKLDKLSKKMIEKTFKVNQNGKEIRESDKKAKTTKKTETTKENKKTKSEKTLTPTATTTTNVEENNEKIDKKNEIPEENKIEPAIINKQNNNNESIKKQLVSAVNTPNNNLQDDNIEDEESPDDSKYISLSEREQLSGRVKRLANDGLASLVRLVQKECPNCIEDIDDEKLMIKIIDLDRKTYEQINQLIDTFLRVRETNQENLGNKRTREKNTNF